MGWGMTQAWLGEDIEIGKSQFLNSKFVNAVQARTLYSYCSLRCVTFHSKIIVAFEMGICVYITWEDSSGKRA